MSYIDILIYLMIVYQSMKPRKSLPKTSLPRIYFIDRKIAEGNYPNAPEMAKEYETSLSSINRDIAYMRDMLDAPIEYDYFKKGFYYTEKTFRLTTFYATADDLLALGMAKNLMELYKDTPVHDAALNLLENISAPLRDEENTGWFLDRIVIPKIAAAAIDEQTWKCIVDALRSNRVITFQYSGKEDLGPVHDKAGSEDGKAPYKKLHTRRVRPYQLLFDRSDWYLFAYDEDRNGMRIFALPRITGIALTDAKFSIPANFDYRSLEGVSHFGIFSGAKTYRFVIAISGDARWVKERLWADDQKIKETQNGIEISFTSNQFDKVLNWVLSLTPQACPLEPKALVEHWKKAVREAAKIAK